MNYIYDITLNFNKNNLYEFYEWKEEDDAEFILKIPMFKVSTEDIVNIKYGDIIVNKNFLKQIEDKTEVYAPNAVNIIRYACIFSSEESSIAVEFDASGLSYMKSNISIDEEVLGEDGKLSLEKFKPITFDMIHGQYIELGKCVGKAFHDGLQLKNN